MLRLFLCWPGLHRKCPTFSLAGQFSCFLKVINCRWNNLVPRVIKHIFSSLVVIYYFFNNKSFTWYTVTSYNNDCQRGKSFCRQKYMMCVSRGFNGLFVGYPIRVFSSSYFTIWRLAAFPIKYCQAWRDRIADFLPGSAVFTTSSNFEIIGFLLFSSQLLIIKIFVINSLFPLFPLMASNHDLINKNPLCWQDL